MAMYYTSAADPNPAAANSPFSCDAKEGTAVNPFVGDVVYLQSPQVSNEAKEEEKVMPSQCARVTTLVLISVALLLTIVTLVLLSVSLSVGHGYPTNDSTYEMAGFGADICCIMGLVEAVFSVVTLIVCVVMTAVKPRRVLASRSTHGMNCLCATIFLLFIFSAVAIGGFAAGMDAPANTQLNCGGMVVAIFATLSKLAYFIDLMVVKCHRHH